MEPMDTSDKYAGLSSQRSYSEHLTGYPRSSGPYASNPMNYPTSWTANKSYAGAVSSGIKKEWRFWRDDRDKLIYLFNSDLEKMVQNGFIHCITEQFSLKIICHQGCEQIASMKMKELELKMKLIFVERFYCSSYDLKFIKKYMATYLSPTNFVKLFISGSKDWVLIFSDSKSCADTEKRKLLQFVFDHNVSSKTVASSPVHRESSDRPSFQPQGGASVTPTAGSSTGFKPDKFRTSSGLEVQIYQGSILQTDVDVIVNAANIYLQHNGGIADVISKAAGARLDYECSSIILQHGCLSVADVVCTHSGVLKYKYVFHAVGPRWEDYREKIACLKDLVRTIQRVLHLAEEKGISRIAIPAISAGVFGVPMELCAEMYVLAVEVFRVKKPHSLLRDIHFVDINEDILRLIKKVCDRVYVSKRNVDLDTISYRYPQYFQSNVNTASVPINRGSSTQTSGGHQNHGSTAHTPSGQRNPVSSQTSTDLQLRHLDDSFIRGGQITIRNFQMANNLFVRIYTGSIVKFSGDAIICSADSSVTGIGPLAEAIKIEGGHKYMDSFTKMRDKNRVPKKGDVLHCKGGNLKVKKVLHLVMDQLSSTSSTKDLDPYKRLLYGVLETANSMNLGKIAIPLIGAGFIERNDKDLAKCCKIILDLMCEFSRHHHPGTCTIKEIHFINRNQNITTALVDIFRKNASRTNSVATSESGSADSQRFKTEKKFKQKKSETDQGIGSSLNDNYHRDQVKKQHHNRIHGFSESQYPDRDFSKSQNYDQDLLKSDANWRGKGARPKSKSHSVRESESSFSEEKQKKQRGYGLNNDLDIDSLLDRSSSLQRTFDRKSDSMLSEMNPIEKGNLKIFDADDLDMMESFETTSLCDDCKNEYQQHSLNKMPDCKHVFCVGCIVPMLETRICKICHPNTVPTASAAAAAAVAGDDDDDEEEEEEESALCVICMDNMTSSCRQLKCGHKFCQECIKTAFTHKPVCPICGTIYGTLKGNQPENGRMDISEEPRSLPGYEGYGTIVIKYYFKDGIQGPDHPNPGKPYKGTERQGFLPDNKMGRKVLCLLRKAFKRGLTFTIGSSRTTGKEDVVTWNDIHHKSKRDTGAERFGYPDPTYLTRVQDELAAKGITE